MNFFTRNNTIIIVTAIIIIAGIILALQFRPIKEAMATLSSSLTGPNRSVIDRQIECSLDKGSKFNYLEGNISLGNARLPSANYFEALDSRNNVVERDYIVSTR